MHAGEDVGVGLPRRTRTSLASLPDEMLQEILLRLPPLPSSLPRASAVRKRWLRIVTDPKFHRQFKPSLLGYFHQSFGRLGTGRIELYSVLDPHERIPPPRFNPDYRRRLIDCRHGLLLLRPDFHKDEVVVCDLIPGVQRSVAIPLELRHGVLRGAVLCAAAAQERRSSRDHVRGRCPFKVVLVCTKSRKDGTIAGVYSSETGRWGNLISTEAECDISTKSAVRIGHCLYWLPRYQSDDILGFDLDDNSLTMIGLPPHDEHAGYCQIIEPEDGVIGFIKSAFPHFQSWQRNVNAHGVATWVPRKTIDMCGIPGLSPRQLSGYPTPRIMGYDEDTDAIYLGVGSSVYEVQLKLMQSRKLYGTINVRYWHHDYYPFKSFHTPGTTIAGELNEAEMVHDA